jgi:hypothetical protein
MEYRRKAYTHLKKILFSHRLSDNNECAGAGSNLIFACGNSVAAQTRKRVALSKGEGSAVKVHNLVSHITVTGKLINCSLGRKRKGGLICQRVVNDKVAISVLAILAGVTIYVCALLAGILYSVGSVANESIPEKSREVIGARIEATVLKEAVIRGCKGVMEDNAVCNSYEATKLVKRSENVKIGGSPGISSSTCVT